MHTRDLTRALVLAVLALLPMEPAGAQAPVAGPPGPGGGPRAALLPPVNPATSPLLRGFRWREIGPLTMGGRVDDLAVVESDPRTFYVGFATGGLWKTVNAGTTFWPVFDTLRHRVDRGRGGLTVRPRTSSGSAPERGTTGRARRSATASTGRRTRVRRSPTSACGRRRASTAW